MHPNYINLANALENITKKINDISVLAAFVESINDKHLRTMLKTYSAIRTVVERSLQIGNIKRAAKYLALLKTITDKILLKHDSCIEELEMKILKE